MLRILCCQHDTWQATAVAILEAPGVPQHKEGCLAFELGVAHVQAYIATNTGVRAAGGAMTLWCVRCGMMQFLDAAVSVLFNWVISCVHRQLIPLLLYHTCSTIPPGSLLVSACLNLTCQAGFYAFLFCVTLLTRAWQRVQP